MDQKATEVGAEAETGLPQPMLPELVPPEIHAETQADNTPLSDNTTTGVNHTPGPPDTAEHKEDVVRAVISGIIDNVAIFAKENSVIESKTSGEGSNGRMSSEDSESYTSDSDSWESSNSEDWSDVSENSSSEDDFEDIEDEGGEKVNIVRVQSLMDLIEVQKRFSDSLHELVSDNMKVIMKLLLDKNPEFITVKEYALLFRSIQVLHPLAAKMLKELKVEFGSASSDAKFGKILEANSKYIPGIFRFIDSIPYSFRELEDIMKTPEKSKKWEEEGIQLAKLVSHFYSPVDYFQNLRKRVSALLESTTEDHVDFLDLKKFQHFLSDTESSMKASLDSAGNARELMELSMKLKGSEAISFVNPGRLHKERIVRKLLTRSTNQEVGAHGTDAEIIFLSDAIIISTLQGATGSASEFTFRNMFYMKETRITDVYVDKWKNVLELSHIDKDKSGISPSAVVSDSTLSEEEKKSLLMKHSLIQQTFLIQAESAAEKQTWLKELHLARHAAEKIGSEQLLMKNLRFGGADRLHPIAWHSVCKLGSMIFVFGGEDKEGRKSGKLWSFDIARQAWALLAPTGDIPSPRDKFSVSAVGKSVYLYGGDNGEEKLNDFYVLDVDTLVWSRIDDDHENGPSEGRAMHTSAVFKKKIFIFGGKGASGAFMNDILCFNVHKGHWSRLTPQGTPPPLRGSHSATMIGDKMYVFGGSSLKKTYNDLHYYDTSNNLWMQVNAEKIEKQSWSRIPSKRYGHMASEFCSMLVVFGGTSPKQKIYGDLHIFDPKSEIWSHVRIGGDKTPLVYSAVSLVYDSIYFIGGKMGVKSKRVDSHITVDKCISLKLISERRNALLKDIRHGRFVSMAISTLIGDEIYVESEKWNITSAKWRKAKDNVTLRAEQEKKRKEEAETRIQEEKKRKVKEERDAIISRQMEQEKKQQEELQRKKQEEVRMQNLILYGSSLNLTEDTGSETGSGHQAPETSSHQASVPSSVPSDGLGLGSSFSSVERESLPFAKAGEKRRRFSFLKRGKKERASSLSLGSDPLALGNDPSKRPSFADFTRRPALESGFGDSDNLQSLIRTQSMMVLRGSGSFESDGISTMMDDATAMTSLTEISVKYVDKDNNSILLKEQLPFLFANAYQSARKLIKASPMIVYINRKGGSIEIVSDKEIDSVFSDIQKRKVGYIEFKVFPKPKAKPSDSVKSFVWDEVISKLGLKGIRKWEISTEDFPSEIEVPGDITKHLLFVLEHWFVSGYGYKSSEMFIDYCMLHALQLLDLNDGVVSKDLPIASGKVNDLGYIHADYSATFEKFDKGTAFTCLEAENVAFFARFCDKGAETQNLPLLMAQLSVALPHTFGVICSGDKLRFCHIGEEKMDVGSFKKESPSDGSIQVCIDMLTTSLLKLGPRAIGKESLFATEAFSITKDTITIFKILLMLLKRSKDLL